MNPPRVRRWLRPLPLASAVMALLIIVKGASLLQHAGALRSAGQAMLPGAHAAAPPPTPAPATAAVAAPIPAPTPLSTPASATAPPKSPPPPPEPGPTAAERALLQELRARRAELEAKGEAVHAREALLAAAERRLTERLDQLASLQTRLEALDQARRERDEANWRSMVKTYETMRPRDAATIFNDLEPTVLRQVLDRMKEAKAAPILAAMQPERARLATADLARWRTRTPDDPDSPARNRP